MRAVVYTTFGGSDHQHVVDLPTPQPGPNQVRIAVHAAPIQTGDLIDRNGYFAEMLTNGRPYVSGWDVAGVVDDVGDSVDDLGLGVEVVGLSDWLTTTVGTHAEYVVLDRDAVVTAPTSISLTESSVLPANTLTALQGLDLLALSHGQTLGITTYAVASRRDQTFSISRDDLRPRAHSGRADGQS